MADNYFDVSRTPMHLGQELQPRILIIAIRVIGDVVLITPLLTLLKKAYPNGYCAVLVDESTSKVLLNNPSINRLIVINRAKSQQEPCWKRGRNWLHLVRDLRKEQFDVVLDLFSGPRSAVLTYFSGAAKRYGEDFRKHGRGFLYSHPIKIKRDRNHLIEQKLELVQTLVGDATLEAGPLELYVTDKEEDDGRRLLGNPPNGYLPRIGLIPSAGSQWRVWPSERFAEIGDALSRSYGAQIVLLGGHDDMSLCHSISDRMQTKSLDLSGQTSLRELIAVLARLDLVISNVTGPMHLASALPRPKVIGLYGAADTVQYAPWSKNTWMLTKGTKNDAYWNQVNYQKDYEYLCRITVADVMDLAQKLLTISK